MDFRFSDEQDELRQNARSFLGQHSSPEQVRSAMQSPLGYDPRVWHELAVELGWASVQIPESYGGLGLGQVDLAVLLEATGEFLLCSPFFSSAALATNAILEIGSNAQKHVHLPKLAEGQMTASLAFAEGSGSWEAASIATTATPRGSDYILSGKKSWVVDGHSADSLIVAARAPHSVGEEGLSVFVVAGDHDGVIRTVLPTMDQTRKLVEIEFSDVHVSSDAMLGEPGEAWTGLRRTLDLAAIALAAEQVGGAQRCLDMAVAYAKERQQFGRAIGSFQAIKHKCADMLIAVETARSALYYAACIADDGSDDLSTNASLAKAWCSESYFRCAAESIQIHGGVGFTWEYDAHLYFKRARASESWLGDPTFHRERVAKAIGL